MAYPGKIRICRAAKGNVLRQVKVGFVRISWNFWAKSIGQIFSATEIEARIIKLKNTRVMYATNSRRFDRLYQIIENAERRNIGVVGFA